MRSDHLIKMHSLGIDDPVVNDARIPGAANGNTQCNNMSTISSTTALYLFLSVLYLGLFLYNALGQWHRRAWTMVTLHPQSQASDLIVENSLVTTEAITEVQSAPAASLANAVNQADLGDVVVKVDRQLLQEEVNDFREEWSSNWDADLSAALASTQYQQQYEQVDAVGASSVAEVGSTEWSELQADPTKISSESQAALDDDDNQIDDELVAESAVATEIESEIETEIETKVDIKTDVQVAAQTAVPSEVPSDMPIVFDYTAKKKLGKVSSTVIASRDSQVQPPKTPQQTRPQSTTPAPVKKIDDPPKNSSTNSALASLWTPQKEKNPTLGINTNSNVNINGFLNAQQRVAVADTQTPIQLSIHLGDLDRDYPNQSFRLYDQFELIDWASNAAGTLLLSPDELPLGEQSFVIEKDHFFPVRITLNADASQAWGEGEYVVPMLSQLKVAQLYTDTAENNQDQLDQGMLMVDLTGAKGMLGPYVNGQAPKAYLDQQLNQTDDLALAQYALFLGLRAGNHLLSFQQPATQDHSAAEQGQYREVSDILFVRPDQITFYAPKIVHQAEQFLNFATQTIYSQKQTALPLPYGAVREEVNDQPLKKLAPSEFLLSSRSKFQQSMALINVKVGDAFFTIDTTMVNASTKNERQTLLLPNLMQVETLLSDLDSDDLQGQCLLDLSFSQPIDGEIEALAEFADDLDGDANVRTDDLKVYYLGEEGVMTDYHTADAQKAYIIAPSTGSVHLKWITADGTMKSKIFPCGNQIYMMSHLD